MSLLVLKQSPRSAEVAARAERAEGRLQRAQDDLEEEREKSQSLAGEVKRQSREIIAEQQRSTRLETALSEERAKVTSLAEKLRSE